MTARTVSAALRCGGLAAVMLLCSACALIGPAPDGMPATAPVGSVAGPVAPVREAPLDTLGLVAYAASMQGKPYVSGGDTPARGFDCSGLVQHVFGTFDYSLPRNAASMAALLPPVALNEIRAADLLFFNTSGTPYSHVGIYLGDGRFVHAPSPRTGRVVISAMANAYWHGRLTAARRPSY